ncbi:MAG: hypothetical protein JNL32_14935 [Candidatus Kapabacteria bacterium]|nr:hypothetical protein [Candidatus Kapabacteria bacterium]
MAEQREQTREQQLGIPPAKPGNWRYYFIFLAVIATTALTLVYFYGQRPKKYETLKKRTIPAIRSAIAVVFSQLDRAAADSAISILRNDVLQPDSSRINMICGGTALYKRFTSADEFLRVTDTAFINAKPITIEKQAVLMSQIAYVTLKDTLPTTLYLFGSLSGTDIDKMNRKLKTASYVLVQRNSSIGSVEIVSNLQPRSAPITQQFLEYFRQKGITVKEK